MPEKHRHMWATHDFAWVRKKGKSNKAQKYPPELEGIFVGQSN